MFENVDQVHGRFLQYEFFKVVYLFVVPKYGMYTYLGGRDFSLHGICSKKRNCEKILIGHGAEEH